ncbi:MAG: hypothetical protein M1817_006194 [Caeruleum heppii]|nr:MAG: hypothetical protein M1817_006194 [Caeruleum heppii]
MASSSPSSSKDLFDSIRATFPSTLRDNCWYLTTASALVAVHRPDVLTDLYLYMIALPEYQTSEERLRLSARLRELLVKEWTLVGIPLVIQALVALAKVEAKEDVDERHSRHNLDPILSALGAHRPAIEWLEETIIYGLFLADPTILDPIETQMVVLPAIMCQGLRGPTMWHIRGTRRLGIAKEDLEGVQSVVERVARWAAWRGVEDWIRVGEVEGEV